jgi:hypothetical protein
MKIVEDITPLTPDRDRRLNRAAGVAELFGSELATLAQASRSRRTSTLDTPVIVTKGRSSAQFERLSRGGQEFRLAVNRLNAEIHRNREWRVALALARAFDVAEPFLCAQWWVRLSPKERNRRMEAITSATNRAQVRALIEPAVFLSALLGATDHKRTADARHLLLVLSGVAPAWWVQVNRPAEIGGLAGIMIPPVEASLLFPLGSRTLRAWARGLAADLAAFPRLRRCWLPRCATKPHRCSRRGGPVHVDAAARHAVASSIACCAAHAVALRTLRTVRPALARWRRLPSQYWPILPVVFPG